MQLSHTNKQPDYKYCHVSDTPFLHLRTDNANKNMLTLSTQKLHNLSCLLSMGGSHYLLMDENSQVFVQSYDPDVAKDGCSDDAKEKKQKKPSPKSHSNNKKVIKHFSD